MTTNGTEALGDFQNRSTERPLPDGWKWTQVGQLYEVHGGGTPATKVSEYWEGDIPWISSADIDDAHNIKPRRFITQDAIDNSATNLVPPGSIIVVTRVGLGKVALTKEQICFSQDSQGLLDQNGAVNPEYALYYLSQATQEFKHQSRGTTIAGVTKKQLKELPFPLAPLSEQERIIAEIEKQFTRLDQAVASLKRLQTNLARYKASVLKAACEGHLVPQDPLDEPAADLLTRILAERRAQWQAANPGKKYQEVSGVETAVLPDLPDGWVWATADQITTRITDGEHITPPRIDSGVFLLSARNVLDGELSLKKVDYISEKTYQELSKRLKIESGDVLLSCSGSVGRSCVAPNLVFSLVRSVAVLKPLFKMGPFLSYLLRSPFLQSQIDEKKTQTAQANIFQGKIKTLVFPLPPLTEQERIVAEVERRLSVVAATEQAIIANLTRAERLRQSILHRAFTGQLV